MKKLELKCWTIWLTFLAVLLFMVSCKTKELTVQKSLEEVKAELVGTSKENTSADVKTESQINQNEVKELVSLLQNLNIGYDGKELSDKLDFLLKKTDEGTKLTIQGKGTANYSETNKKEFESLKIEIFKRQDSLYNLQSSAFNSLHADIYQFINTKDKDVKVKGFQAGAYITIGVVLIVLAILAWIAKRFKLFSKIESIFSANGGMA